MPRPAVDVAGRWSRAAVAAMLLAGAVLTTLHVVARPTPTYMSQWARSPFAVLFLAAILTVALGLSAFMLAMVRRVSPSPWRALALVGNGVSVVGLLVVLGFWKDALAGPPTLVGWIHDKAQVPTFVLLCLSPLVWSRAFRADPAWARSARLALAWGTFSLAIVLAYAGVQALGWNEAIPWAQRGAAASALGWHFVVAVGAARAPQRVGQQA